MSALHRLFLGVALVLSLAVSGLLSDVRAQTAAGPDYETWSSTALRAEEAIEAGRASNVAMQGLRNELADWRQQFAQAQSVNAKTIDAVKAQLEALGPAPENGTEPDDIAAQRTDLNQRLAQLQVPAKTAQVALSRADVLISSIDEILRDRQAEALLVRGPVPLNPVIWPRGWTAISQSVVNTRGEIQNAWANPLQQSAFWQNLPAVLALVSVSLLMLVLGRLWMLRLAFRVQSQGTETPGRWLLAFGLSLGQLLLPLVGLAGLVEAAYLTGLVGLRTAPLLGEVTTAGLYVFGAIWLGARVFPKAEVPHRPMHLSPDQLRQGRLVTGLIGSVLAARIFLVELARYDTWSDPARAVVFFPVIVFGGVLIWRLGGLLRAHGTAALKLAETEGENLRYAERMYRLLGRTLLVVAFIGPLLAAAGYLPAAQWAVFPVMDSLLLIAVVLVLQRAVSEAYVLIVRREEARDGLVPVLAGLVLILLAAPRFAKIWGVSDTQMAEIWLKLREGLDIGGIRISPTVFLTFAVVFTAGYVVTRLLQGALKTTVLPKTRMDGGAQNALVSGVGYVGIVLAALIAVTTAGIDLSSLAIVAGALSVGIGFGLQNIVQNFVSGIILLIERPISEGDWIEVDGTQGTVRAISVRSTRIETFDRSQVILPNADLISGKVTNYTRGNTVGRLIVPVGVAYGTDTRKVESVLREIAEAHPMVVVNPPPSVLFQGFGADSMDFEIRAILRDVNWILSVRTDLNHEIARRFTEEGIEIPFAQRDVWFRNPEALTGQPKPEDTAPVVPSSEPEPAQFTEGDFEGGDGEGGER